MNTARRSPWVSLGGWALACYLVAAIGAVASVDAEQFYLNLDRPPWAPPPDLFGPVWTVLYGMMAIAVWRVWRCIYEPDRPRALLLFVVQLVLNALWSWIFFKWHLGALATIEILALWIVIVATTVTFFKVSEIAGALMLPYLMWVTFAMLLTVKVWQLNPSTL